MSDPRICKCGCHQPSRQVAFLISVLEKSIFFLIKDYADKPSGVVEEYLSRKITILTYLKGLKNEPD